MILQMMEAVVQGEDGPEGWAALREKHGGLCKPDIVFFGEALPDRFWTCVESDFPKCDLLLVMGTSLTVAPFSSLVNKTKDDVPRVLINREAVGMRNKDVPEFVNKLVLGHLELGTGFR